jgi:hypothetical protein
VTHGLTRSLLPHFVPGARPISSAIYGTVSVMAVVVVGAHGASGAGEVLRFAAVSMVVIWGIHVYASVLAEAGTAELHWRVALRAGLRDEVGVIEGATVPLAVLLLAPLGVVDDSTAIWASVWCGVGLLTLMPAVWLRRIGSGWAECVMASAVAGFFGLLLVALKVFVH